MGGNDIGIREAKTVVIEGIGGACPSCHHDFMAFDVILEDNKLKQIVPVGLDRPEETGPGFTVIA